MQIIVQMSPSTTGFIIVIYRVEALASLPNRNCAGDFSLVKEGMTDEEAHQEASRCLRCDHFGFGSFKGGRKTEW